MNSSICVDANLVLDWLLPAQKSEAIDHLWQQWKEAKTRLVVPPLFHAEVTSTIRAHVFFKHILPEEGEALFSEYLMMNLNTIYNTDIVEMAWELAILYNRPRTYDMQYLAVAELEGCDFWTADKRLVNSLRGKTERVKFLGDATGKGI